MNCKLICLRYGLLKILKSLADETKMEGDNLGIGADSKSSSDLWVATGAPFLLGLSYVGSLYVWRSSKDRDHDDTIKRRFISRALQGISRTVCGPFWCQFATCPRISVSPVE